MGGVKLRLFLIQIANHGAGGKGDGSRIGRQFPQHQLEQGGFARAVGRDEHHTVAVVNGGRQVLDERPCPERLAHPVKADDLLAGQFGGGKVGVHRPTAEGLFDGLRLEVGQPLLGIANGGRGCFFGRGHLCFVEELIPIGGGTAAPPRKRLLTHQLAQPLYLLLLRLVQGHLFLEQPLSLLQIKVVIAMIEGDFSLAGVQFGDDIDHPIEKVAVVGDEQDAPFVGGQGGFQPRQRFKVEVVGWLVEEEQGGGLQEQTRQGHPPPFAAAEAGQRPCPL